MATMMSLITKSVPSPLSPLWSPCLATETQSTTQHRAPNASHRHHLHHHHHNRRLRQNSLSSSQNDGSSDSLSGYASSFESTSSFSDDFLGYEQVTEGSIEVSYEDKRCEMVIDENLCSSDLCQLLIVKMNLNQSQNYALILQLIDFNLERVLLDEEEVLPQYTSHSAKFKCKLTLKTNHFHYDFIQNPLNYFPLYMISFGTQEDTSNKFKIASLQDQLTSSKNLNVTISGPLQYHKQLDNEIIESKKVIAQINCVCEQFVCSEVETGRKTVFNVHRHNLFYPINDFDCKPQLRGKDSFVFALINDENKGIHWFTTTSEIQRQRWLFTIRIVKYGLNNLRNSYLKSRRETGDNISMSTTYFNMNQRVDYSSQDLSSDSLQVSIETVRDSRRKTSLGRSSPVSCTERPVDRGMQHLSEPWFYPEMSRKEANDCLQKYASVDGVFLVRPSQRNPGSFMLSFVSKERVKHVQIFVTDESAQISLSLDCGRTKFYDLKQLVEFYQLNIGCLPTKLTHFLVHR